VNQVHLVAHLSLAVAGQQCVFVCPSSNEARDDVSDSHVNAV